MSTHVNLRSLQGLTGGTIAWTVPESDGDPAAGAALAGYVSPNLQGFALSHKCEVEKIPNQSGNTASMIITDEYLEITWDYIPQGTNRANALAAAQLPPPGSKGEIEGLPIIKIGNFTDGLNTDGASTQPWIYEGDGGLDGKVKEHWDGKITLRRYRDIPSDAPLLVISDTV